MVVGESNSRPQLDPDIVRAVAGFEAMDESDIWLRIWRDHNPGKIGAEDPDGRAATGKRVRAYQHALSVMLDGCQIQPNDACRGCETYSPDRPLCETEAYLGYVAQQEAVVEIRPLTKVA